jgi:hypothetical protein
MSKIRLYSYTGAFGSQKIRPGFTIGGRTFVLTASKNPIEAGTVEGQYFKKTKCPYAVEVEGAERVNDNLSAYLILSNKLLRRLEEVCDDLHTYLIA